MPRQTSDVCPARAIRRSLPQAAVPATPILNSFRLALKGQGAGTPSVRAPRSVSAPLLTITLARDRGMARMEPNI